MKSWNEKDTAHYQNTIDYVSNLTTAEGQIVIMRLKTHFRGLFNKGNKELAHSYGKIIKMIIA